MKDIEEYLLHYQPAIHGLFARARNANRWSHAYLLHGRPGQPMQRIAQYLAQSLLCEQPSPLACGTCLTCMRLEANDYTDFISIDGSETSIKKQDVLNLSSRFAITGLEKANKQIYVLHLVEFMTPEAINALLKFLEEPQQEIYALMTTENLDAVLPTIQSRSQVIHFKSTDQSAIIAEAILAGVNEADAQLLSFECGTKAEISEISASEPYLLFRQHLQAMTTLWATNKTKAHYYFRQEWLPLLLEDTISKVFLKRWIILIQELVKASTKQAMILKAYGSMLLGIAKQIPDPYQAVNRLQKRLSMLDKSTNISLFLEATMIELLGVIS